MKHINSLFKRLPASQLIALGFATVILIGTILLLLPVSVREGVKVSFIDALFTSTSAVCVTGLIAIDTADHFTAFGQGVVAALIQIGGLCRRKGGGWRCWTGWGRACRFRTI